ncbi:MAG: DUF2254 domain-containing protein [Halanaerobiaceae bacterium]
MLKKKFYNLRSRIYFIPGCYSLAALIISIILIYIDTQYSQQLQLVLPEYLFTSIDLAKTILSTLAGSIFAMITVSFSTIMVVLTMYSSQFSPRTLQDFLQSKTTLKVLGVFCGGFIYSILTLLFLHDTTRERVVFSADIGVFVAILCLGYFVYFIHHVADSVRVNILVERLRDEILEIVERIDIRTDTSREIRNHPPENVNDLLTGEPVEVYAGDYGYIQRIYDIELTELADELDVIIRAEKMVGDYVTGNSLVFTIWRHEGEIENPEKFLDYVLIDRERSKKNDIEFGMLKLTEVALKAISPAINDPNTAIFCINQLGWILSRIAVSGIERTYFFGAEDRLRLIQEDITFDQLLYKTFYQLCYYGNEDVSIAGSILDALLIIAEGSPPEVKNAVWKFSDFVLGKFNKEILHKEDKRFINRKIYKLARETKQGKEFYKYFKIE